MDAFLRCLLPTLVFVARVMASPTKEHFYVNVSLEWQSARDYCQNKYKDLSTISSQDENSAFLEAVQDSGGDIGWIGLKRTNHDDWKWTDDTHFSFTNWLPGQPDDRNGQEDCVQFIVRGDDTSHWNDIKCSRYMPFFCYHLLPSIFLVQEEKTWEEALEHCRAQYLDITSPTDDKVMRVAQRRARRAQTPAVWIGFRLMDGLWVSASGDLPGGQMSLPSCPAAPLHCVAINSDSLQVENRDCSERLYFTCHTY